jgi:hypothetical protein
MSELAALCVPVDLLYSAIVRPVRGEEQKFLPSTRPEGLANLEQWYSTFFGRVPPDIIHFIHEL